jgi:hypothetical protein
LAVAPDLFLAFVLSHRRRGALPIRQLCPARGRE